MLGAVLGIAGAAQSIYNNMDEQNKMKRMQEEFVKRQESQITRAQEQNQLISPRAAQREKARYLQQGKAGAVAQAGNIGGANVANSGLGGDVTSAQIGGVKAAAPVLAASSPYDQALAGTISQREQEQAQKVARSESLAMTGARIGDMVNYVDEGGGAFSNVLSGIAGGVNLASNLQGLQVVDPESTDTANAVQADPNQAPMLGAGQDSQDWFNSMSPEERQKLMGNNNFGQYSLGLMQNRLNSY